ncbi:MarR family winged helix-turn-helix transcriptional regulator [Bradyrhizobium sp. McL0615]|uniref:MarR family winged helix-turn-helix transcriptional regulator n=1 Tax=Bradyrhizobium sp. McL0615 TaxID=3415673 RepID=UPI003CF697F9
MGSEVADRKLRMVNTRKGNIEPKRLKRTTLKTGDIQEVQRALELFLFAHLNLAADAEAELASLGFHRTHHRILYLVAGHPGASVGDLINTLRLTPQAVQSPMRQLNDKGYVEQRYSSVDRRKRRLFITPKGEALVARLSSRQHGRLEEAFDLAGATAVKGFLKVMESMLSEEDRDFVERSSI